MKLKKKYKVAFRRSLYLLANPEPTTLDGLFRRRYRKSVTNMAFAFDFLDKVIERKRPEPSITGRPIKCLYEDVLQY